MGRGVVAGVPPNIGSLGSAQSGFVDVTLGPYRADRTGSANAASAIQAAIDANPAGTIFFPPGRYKLTTGLTLSGGVTLKGTNYNGTYQSSTLFAGQGATIDAMIQYSGTTGAVEDLKIDCSYDEDYTHRVANYGIKSDVGMAGPSTGIRRVSCYYAKINGIYLNDAELVLFHQVYALGAGAQQWYVRDCNGARFLQCGGTTAPDSVGPNFEVAGISHEGGVYIDGLDMEGTGDTSGSATFYIHGVTGPLTTLRNLYMEQASATPSKRGHGVLISGCDNVLLEGSFIAIQGNVAGDTGASSNRIVKAHDSYNVTIRDNSWACNNDSAVCSGVQATGTTSGMLVENFNQQTGQVIPAYEDDQTTNRNAFRLALTESEKSFTPTNQTAGAMIGGERVWQKTYRGASRPALWLFDAGGFYESIRSVGQAFRPLDRSDLVDSWDVRSGVTNTSGNCSAWAGARGTSATATSGKRPAIVTGINNLSTLRFDGSDDFMSITLGATLVDFTSYQAFVLRSGFAGAAALWAFGTFSPELYITSGLLSVYDGSDLFFDVFGGALQADQPYICAITRNTATSKYSCALYTYTAGAGISGQYFYTTRTSVNASTGTTLTLAAQDAAGNGAGKIDLYRLDFYNTVHDDTTRNLVIKSIFGMLGV